MKISELRVAVIVLGLFVGLAITGTALSAETVTTIWSAKLPNTEAGLISPDGTWFVLVRQGVLEAYSDEGVKLWERRNFGKVPRHGGYLQASRLVAFFDSEHIVFGTKDRHLGLVDKTGKTLWAKKLAGLPVEIRLAADRSAIAVASDVDYDSVIQVFTPNGDDIWSTGVKRVFHFDVSPGGRMVVVAWEDYDKAVLTVYRASGQNTQLLAVTNINTEEGDMFARISPDQTRVAVLPVPTEQVGVFDIQGGLLFRQSISVNGWGPQKTLEFMGDNLVVAGMDGRRDVLMLIGQDQKATRIYLEETNTRKEAFGFVDVSHLDGDTTLLALVEHVYFGKKPEVALLTRVDITRGTVTRLWETVGRALEMSLDSSLTRALVLTDREVHILQLPQMTI